MSSSWIHAVFKVSDKVYLRFSHRSPETEMVEDADLLSVVVLLLFWLGFRTYM